MRKVNYTDVLLDSAKIASKYGLKLIDVKIVELITVLTVECNKGHQWKTPLEKVEKGLAECRHCSGKSLSPTDRFIKAKGIAYQHKGRCLSTKYISDSSLMEWETKDGIRFISTYNDVVNQGFWYVPRSERKDDTPVHIKRAKALAESNGAKCLSPNDTERGSVLTWECAHGHTFEAKYEEVLNKKIFCKKCKLENQKNYRKSKKS